MTITEKERQRIINGSEDKAESTSRHRRSGIVVSFLGMLAGLGTLTLVTATLVAGAALVRREVVLVTTDGSIQELSLIGLSLTGLIILGSSMMGGFVAGRLARSGGMVVGVGSSLWLTLVIAGFSGLALWLGNPSAALDGTGLADRLNEIAVADLTTAAAVAGAGLFVIALIGGVLGGRLGEIPEPTSGKSVVDLRTPEPDMGGAHEDGDQTEDQEPVEATADPISPGRPLSSGSDRRASP